MVFPKDGGFYRLLLMWEHLEHGGCDTGETLVRVS